MLEIKAFNRESSPAFDIADFKAMNGGYVEHFSEPFPARVCFQVAALPLGAKVEIETVAVK